MLALKLTGQGRRCRKALLPGHPLSTAGRARAAVRNPPTNLPGRNE